MNWQRLSNRTDNAFWPSFESSRGEEFFLSGNGLQSGDRHHVHNIVRRAAPRKIAGWTRHALQDRAQGLRVEADLSSDKLGAKIRNARVWRAPYLLVVGPKEAEGDAVGVRSRDAGELGAMKVDELVARLLAEAKWPGALAH